MMKATYTGRYKISEENSCGSIVTWVHRIADNQLIRGFWDSCPVTRRDNALNLVQDLNDGTKKETYHGIYGPAPQWEENEPLPPVSSLFEAV